MWRKGNPFALLVEMQTGVATVESSMEIVQKIKSGSALWPSNPTSGTISKGTQNTNSKEHKHPCVHYSIVYNRHDVEAAQVSFSRWVDKTARGHLYNGTYSAIKKKKILPSETLCWSSQSYRPIRISVRFPALHSSENNAANVSKSHLSLTTSSFSKFLFLLFITVRLYLLQLIIPFLFLIFLQRIYYQLICYMFCLYF